MENRRYNHTVIIITDAASAFGSGSAKRLAAGGAALVLAGRPESGLEDLAEECGNLGGRAVAAPTDMTREDDVRQLGETAITQFGRIDVWINNAGSGAVGRFEQMPLADHLKVIQTDLVGTIQGSYYALKQFRRQGAGILINVASVVGKVPAPYFASYVAAKQGVVGLDAAIRQELKEDKIDAIRVCTLMPTTFDTPFFEHAGQQASPLPAGYSPAEVIDTLVELVANPKDEVSVGSGAKVSILAHQLFPGIVESYMARETHKAEMESAPPPVK